MDEKQILYNNIKLENFVKNFTNSPFLFIGSGFSKRYINTPSWPTLLKHFSDIIKPNDDFAFDYYLNRSNKNFQIMGSLISTDYNDAWFSDLDFRNSQPKDIEDYLKENKISPFHVAVATYLKTFTKINDKYDNEIQDFKILRGHSLAGIITTNYDNLLDELTDYKSYIGQTELLASSPIGVGEIYKIHGSINKPESIIITDEDYHNFNDKAQYLSAKLITLFIENPIFFIGYSLNDTDIRNIFNTIIHCFSDSEQTLLNKFSTKMFIIEYDEKVTLSISDYDYSENLKLIRITMSDFSIFYKALSKHRQLIPVKLMRKLKSDFCKFAETNIPTTTIQVMDLENERLSDKDLAIWIGTQKKVNELTGHVPITRDEIFTDIILDNLSCSANDILNNFFPTYKSNIAQTPPCKYISQATKIFPSNIVVPNYKSSLQKINHVNSIITDRSIKGIFKLNADLHLIIDYIACLSKDEIIIEDLKDKLEELLTEYPDIFEKAPKIFKGKAYKTQLRKAIRIYDYLKYGELAKKNIENVNKKNKSHEESSK